MEINQIINEKASALHTLTLADYNEGKRDENRRVRICFGEEPTLEEATEKANRVIEEASPVLTGIAYASDIRSGSSDEYLSSIISYADIWSLDMGESVLIASPTGSGKTRQMISIALSAANDDMKVIHLTNRIACKTQLIKDYLTESQDGSSVSVDSALFNNELFEIKIHPNLKVMTYQEFVHRKREYDGKKMLLILDEIHCCSEDSTFTTYGQKMLDFITDNVENTKRIYITATPEYILPEICRIEALTDDIEYYKPISYETETCKLVRRLTGKKTRITTVFQMKSSWEHLDFKFYTPDDLDSLAEYLKGILNEEKGKAFSFFTGIKKGTEFMNKLESLKIKCQQVYSDIEKKEELDKIACEEKFDGNVLIATKVAENGISLHDKNLIVIIAHSYDPIAIQQIIGRARVSRKSPKKLIILIPDFSASNLGSIEGDLIKSLTELKKDFSDKEYTMENKAESTCNVFFDSKEGIVKTNDVKMRTLDRLVSLVSELNESKEHHAFAKYVLSLYDKKESYDDRMLLNYDSIRQFSDDMKKAWEKFKASAMEDKDIQILKEEAVEAYNTSLGINKPLTAKPQLKKLNELLKMAGIKEAVSENKQKYSVSLVEDAERICEEEPEESEV